VQANCFARFASRTSHSSASDWWWCCASLSGNRLLTSGAEEVIQLRFVRRDWPQLVNGDSAPEFGRQPQESRQQLEKVMHLVENLLTISCPSRASALCNQEIISRCQQLVCFAFRQPNPAANLSGSRRSTQGSNSVLLWLLMNLSQLSPSVFLYCIAAAAVLIYLPFGCGLCPYARGVDLAAPRTMFDKLPPYAQRANWAHQNSLEAFMILRQRRWWLMWRNKFTCLQLERRSHL